MSTKPVAWVTCGGATQDEKTLTLNKKLLNLGWEEFIQQDVWPVVEMGYDVFLHNPFGKHVGPEMELDQIYDLLAKQFSTDRFYYNKIRTQLERASSESEFTSVVKKVVAEGIEVIAYFGNVKRWPTDLNSRQWIDRVFNSISAALAAGCSVGFDSGISLKGEDPMTSFILLLNSLGTRCYVEPWPHQQNVRLHRADIGWVGLESVWQGYHKYNPRPYYNEHYNIIRCIDRDSYEGKVNRRNTLQLAYRIQKDGHRVSIPHWRIKQFHITASDLASL